VHEKTIDLECLIDLELQLANMKETQRRAKAELAGQVAAAQRRRETISLVGTKKKAPQYESPVSSCPL
jgi:hypothetical protein